MRPTAAVLALPLLLTAATMAPAGAWLRGEGEAMLSFSHEALRPDGGGGTSGYTTFYGEYGGSGRLTLGLDLGKGEASQDWKALAFARIGRDFGWLPGQVSAELGLGAVGVPGGGAEPVIRPALSWGKGLATPWGNGWINLDALAEHRPERARTGVKLELTLGVTPTDRTQVSVQLRAEDPAQGERTLRLVPTLARRMGDRAWVTLGGIVGLEGDGDLGLLIGSRIEF